MPIFERGLEDYLRRGVQRGRITAKNHTKAFEEAAQVFVISVGTPALPDGKSDLRALNTVVDSIANHLSHDTVIMIKSTIPVGTTRKVADKINLG